MKDKILEILKQCAFKGLYSSVLKKEGLWTFIDSNLQISDGEKIYRFLNPDCKFKCRNENPSKFKGVKNGYSAYCNVKTCSCCKEDRLAANKHGLLTRYGVDNAGKLPQAIESRDKFWSDDHAVAIAKHRRIQTNLELYGVEHIFQNEEIKARQRSTLLEKYGVDNISKLETTKIRKKETLNSNYGVDSPLQSDVIKERSKQTNLHKYGTEYPMQNKIVSDKMMNTKIQNGSFAKSNSSIEATNYIRNYIKQKGYQIEQCAYADLDLGLHEWGTYYDGKWALFDLVVFELGHRGNSSKIIEILEYHGPFHYSEFDVRTRGHMPAYPWKTNATTILESYNNDIRKKKLALLLTSYYTIVNVKEIDMSTITLGELGKLLNARIKGRRAFSDRELDALKLWDENKPAIAEWSKLIPNFQSNLSWINAINPSISQLASFNTSSKDITPDMITTDPELLRMPYDRLLKDILDDFIKMNPDTAR